MKLYGTTTSPFVRRVRVVASELGIAYDRIDTASDGGQATLRELSPIRKVPLAVVDGGRTIFDSRAIIEWLTEQHGYGPLAAPTDRWHHSNLLNAVDGALESVLQVFVLKRDGIAVDGSVFAIRQFDRARAIFDWLASQLTVDSRLGLPELSLICALEWMEFRKSFPTDDVPPRLAEIRAAWRERPSLVATRPVV